MDNNPLDANDLINNLNEKYQMELQKIKADRDAQQLAISTDPINLQKYNELKNKLQLIDEAKKDVEKEIMLIEDIIHINKCTICDMFVPNRLLEKCITKHWFCKKHEVHQCKYPIRYDCGPVCPEHACRVNHKHMQGTFIVCPHHKKCYEERGYDSD